MEKKNKKIAVIISAICVILVLGLAGYFMSRQNSDSDSAFWPDLDPNAGVPSKQEEEKPEGIRIPGYPAITIDAGETEVTMNLMNPKGNPCYFTFELVLTESDETIYTSKMVEPGKTITNVTLSRPLEKGEYPAVIKITTASLEDGSQMNGANVETILVAE